LGRKNLIVTGLRNHRMLFIRYQNGDCIELLDEVCKCGRSTPLMSLNVARQSDIFLFKNGKEYPSLYFILRLYN